MIGDEAWRRAPITTDYYVLAFDPGDSLGAALLHARRVTGGAAATPLQTWGETVGGTHRYSYQPRLASTGARSEHRALTISRIIEAAIGEAARHLAARDLSQLGEGPPSEILARAAALVMGRLFAVSEYPATTQPKDSGRAGSQGIVAAKLGRWLGFIELLALQRGLPYDEVRSTASDGWRSALDRQELALMKSRATMRRVTVDRASGGGQRIRQEDGADPKGSIYFCTLKWQGTPWAREAKAHPPTPGECDAILIGSGWVTLRGPHRPPGEREGLKLQRAGDSTPRRRRPGASPGGRGRQ